MRVEAQSPPTTSKRSRCRRASSTQTPVPTDRVSVTELRYHAPREPPTMSDLIGRTLGHYRITAKIGAGGMGVVYRAIGKQVGWIWKNAALYDRPTSWRLPACGQRSGFLRSRRGAYRDRRLDGAHEHNFFWSRLEAGFNIACFARRGEGSVLERRHERAGESAGEPCREECQTDTIST